MLNHTCVDSDQLGICGRCGKPSADPIHQPVFPGDAPTKMAEGCCSAISPCGHQQRDPSTICDVCQKAAARAAPQTVTVLVADLHAWRKAWLDENDPKDGTDCVTPFDQYLYTATQVAPAPGEWREAFDRYADHDEGCDEKLPDCSCGMRQRYRDLLTSPAPEPVADAVVERLAILIESARSKAAVFTDNAGAFREIEAELREASALLGPKEFHNDGVRFLSQPAPAVKADPETGDLTSLQLLRRVVEAALAERQPPENLVKLCNEAHDDIVRAANLVKLCNEAHDDIVRAAATPAPATSMAAIVESNAPREWLIQRKGLFYRPDAAGYTSRKNEAGRYTYSEAKSEEERVAGVSVVHQDAIVDDKLLPE